MLTLFDWTPFGVDVVEFAIYGASLVRCRRRAGGPSVLERTIVGAAAHAMALDTGRASPLLAIDDRHSAVVTRGQCGRRR